MAAVAVTDRAPAPWPRTRGADWEQKSDLNSIELLRSRSNCCQRCPVTCTASGCAGHSVAGTVTDILALGPFHGPSTMLDTA
jgi:hypothetical protein